MNRAMTPLPCPFCGETSGVVAQTGTFRWRAWVCGCGVVGPEIRIQTLGEGTQAEWEAAATLRAIEAWNERKWSMSDHDNQCEIERNSSENACGCDLRAQLAALREAAGKVQCENCHGSGFKAVRDEGALTFTFPPCPDCGDLRRLLGEKT